MSSIRSPSHGNVAEASPVPRQARVHLLAERSRLHPLVGCVGKPAVTRSGAKGVVEPRGLEPLTPCLQSGGMGLAERH